MRFGVLFFFSSVATTGWCVTTDFAMKSRSARFTYAECSGDDRGGCGGLVRLVGAGLGWRIEGPNVFCLLKADLGSICSTCTTLFPIWISALFNRMLVSLFSVFSFRTTFKIYKPFYNRSFSWNRLIKDIAERFQSAKVYQLGILANNSQKSV